MLGNDFSHNSLDCQPLIIFDGLCNLCEKSVVFIINHDPQAKFHFVSLQSVAGQLLIKKYQILQPLSSVILLKNNQLFFQSDAALMILAELESVAIQRILLTMLPKPIRNWFYQKIAKNRYRWFGKREECLIPTAENRQRFIIDESIIT